MKNKQETTPEGPVVLTPAQYVDYLHRGKAFPAGSMVDTLYGYMDPKEILRVTTPPAKTSPPDLTALSR